MIPYCLRLTLCLALVALAIIGPKIGPTEALPVRKRPAGNLPTLTLRATHHAYHDAPVTVTLDALSQPRDSTQVLTLIRTDGKERLPCQIDRQIGGNRVALSFLLPDLPQSAARTYHLRWEPHAHAVQEPLRSVVVTSCGDDLNIIIIEGKTQRLFTTYTTHSGPNKPFFYPILTPEGQPMTRRWPLEPDTTESHDHPHHRGLWFTHTGVNGVDFWSEQGHYGKTINTGYEAIVGGPVYGGFRAHTDWRDPDGHLLATDVREIRVIPLTGEDRLLEFTVSITPTDQPLTFSDNKDGTFGLRLPDSLAPNPDKSAHITAPTGHILNSEGQKDGDAWGKHATWVDYWGPIGGRTYGVAIFDAPANLRHPQTWHARDYGLFCANPFALHDFHLGEKGAGDYTLPLKSTLTLHYGVLFHHGDAAEAAIAARYADWADPPDVIVH